MRLGKAGKVRCGQSDWGKVGCVMLRYGWHGKLRCVAVSLGSLRFVRVWLARWVKVWCVEVWCGLLGLGKAGEVR